MWERYTRYHHLTIHRVMGRLKQQWSQWEKNLFHQPGLMESTGIICHALCYSITTQSMQDGQSFSCSEVIRTSCSGCTTSPSQSIKPEWHKPVSGIEDTYLVHSRQMELAYNRHAHNLSELHVGNHIAMQNHISLAVGHLWSHYCYMAILEILRQNSEWLHVD